MSNKSRFQELKRKSFFTLAEIIKDTPITSAKMHVDFENKTYDYIKRDSLLGKSVRYEFPKEQYDRFIKLYEYIKKRYYQ